MKSPILDSWLALIAITFVACWSVDALAQQSPEFFSGPQVGEELASFKVLGVFDDQAGNEFDLVQAAGDGAILLIFVHDVNRQSIAMTRVLATYSSGRSQDGLTTGVVFLGEDVTETENTLKRIRHALAPNASTGISVDGREGPGMYGLNRNAMLTILVGKGKKVTANFALVQPSLQVDLPKILASVVDVVGGTVPELSELEGMPEMARADVEDKNQQADQLRSLLRPVIRKDATPEQVDAAAKKVEEYAAVHSETKKEIGRIASTIVNSGKLENYGTARAQEVLRRWAKEYGEPIRQQRDDPNKQANDK